MKTKTLAILVTSVLLISSFTFSSCKDCSKKKAEPTGRGGATNDAADNASNTTSDPSDASDPDNPNPDIDIAILSEIERYLSKKGAGPAEIEATKHIATEHFGNDIGRVLYDNGHYYYRDDMGDHDGQPAGTQNCGLYAIKRLLFVLGKHPDTGIDKNLWYKHTDDELRGRCKAEARGVAYNGERANHAIVMHPEEIILLMHHFGVEGECGVIWRKNGLVLPVALPPPVMRPEEVKAELAVANKLRQRSLDTLKKAQDILEAAKADGVTKDQVSKLLKNIDPVVEEMNKIYHDISDWCDRVNKRAEISYGEAREPYDEIDSNRDKVVRARLEVIGIQTRLRYSS